MPSKFWALFLMSGLVTLGCFACQGGETPIDIEKPDHGSADAVGRLCQDAGLPADCDICAERGWLDDGECDDFCATPDPDCEQPDQVECSWETSSPLGESSSDLRDLEIGSVTVDIDDIDELTVMQNRQIWTACAHLDFVEGNEDFDVVFEAADEGTFYLKELSLDGRAFDWVRFYAGDTEVGVVFVAATLEIVAEISDGDVKDCGMPAPPEGDLSCSWDIDSPVGDSSDGLAEAASNSKTVTIDDIDGLSDLESQQIFAAAQHLEFVVGDEDFDVVFEVADEGEFYLSDLDLAGILYDWVKFYAGDTEVGVVFADGTTDIVAEIGDGDVMGCSRL